MYWNSSCKCLRTYEWPCAAYKNAVGTSVTSISCPLSGNNLEFFKGDATPSSGYVKQAIWGAAVPEVTAYGPFEVFELSK